MYDYLPAGGDTLRSCCQVASAGGLSSSDNIVIYYAILYRVSKKTEFCRIEHLQILLAVDEKYL